MLPSRAFLDQGRGELPDLAVLAEMGPVHLIAGTKLARDPAGADDRERRELVGGRIRVRQPSHGPVLHGGRDAGMKIGITTLADRCRPVAVQRGDLPHVPVPPAARAEVGHRRIGQLVELEAADGRLRTCDSVL